MSSSVSLLSSASSRQSEIDEGFPTIDPSRIHIFHDKVLMNGDSAVVCKAQFLNLPCAAKYIHHKLVETSSWQLEMFEKGCKILQGCRHPNIVTTLGIHRDNRLKQPILLMELMDQSLKELLDHRKLDLPLYFQLDICSDVAQGLDYLHAKDIIHGNLTATNVLIKGGRAKIGGLMSLQINTPDGELSLCPGAPESMPRRSFSCADYDEAIDCFSFGVIGIYIATRKLPQPNTLARKSSEVERYEKDLQKVEDKKHPLYALIIKCLNNIEYLRPSATKLCEELASMIRSSAYRISQAAEHKSTELVSLQNEYIRDRLCEKTEEIEALQKEFKYKQTELESANEALKKELEYKQGEIEAANRAEESLKNRLALVVLRNEDLEKKNEAATKELDLTKNQVQAATRKSKDTKKQSDEAAMTKDRMYKGETQLMRQKIDELQKESDDYKHKLEESDRNYAELLFKQNN